MITGRNNIEDLINGYLGSSNSSFFSICPTFNHHSRHTRHCVFQDINAVPFYRFCIYNTVLS